MAMISCYECGKEISSDAPACPHCGAPRRIPPPPPPPWNEQPGVRSALRVGAVGVVMFGLLATCLMSSPNPTPGTQSAGRWDVPADPSPYDLEVVSYRCTRPSDGFIVTTGEVRNISTVRLRNVEAVVSYYAADDTIVETDSALIEYNPLLDGQTSPFRITTQFNPAMTTCGQPSFKDLLTGAAIDTVYRETLIRQAQEFLIALKRLPGKPDGRLGPNTRRALEKFAKEHGMTWTGGTIPPDLTAALKQAYVDRNAPPAAPQATKP